MRSMLAAVLAMTVLPVVGFAQPGVAFVGNYLPNSGSERYYVTLFGGHGDLFQPRTSHTWATFSRTATTTSSEQVVAEDTISWLPATLNVRPWALMAETGRNLTLRETFAFMGQHPRRRVVAFGPYEITAERYAQAMAQKALLESGAIRYHALGLFGRRSDVMHCIDGVTRTDRLWERKADPSWWFGEAGTGQATRAAVRSGFILNPTVTHPWLLHTMNPTGHKLVVRDLGVRPLLGVAR